MKKYTYTESKDTRSGFGAGLLEAGKKKRPNCCALCRFSGFVKNAGFH